MIANVPMQWLMEREQRVRERRETRGRERERGGGGEREKWVRGEERGRDKFIDSESQLQNLLNVNKNKNPQTNMKYNGKNVLR